MSWDALKNVTSIAATATIQGLSAGLVMARPPIETIKNIWAISIHPLLRPKNGGIKRSRKGAHKNFKV
ncbi:hypothetical protein BMS3Abin09_00046 [bacterium BMS3Abin09]|nr:hypothetical protein BMS3Abin09_00046 [bacterium BMS3Abin09]